MPASIGVNLRVTGHCKQGGRKYMEDYFSVAYQQTEDEKDLEYAFFGIFDGHGGSEAATYAKEHLMESIVRQRLFWSDKDEDVLKAIKEGFIQTHMAMWKEQEKWPKTASGLPSTAGTTASIAFIRRGKIFTGHVGDSGIILGYQNPGSQVWEAKRLTKDHKPECEKELTRIEQSGGKVVTKSGVPRVVWYRPQLGHKGPITRSTPHDEIPFLAVARSLGDLWSYNSANDQFVVSPEPDTNVLTINTNTFRCLIFGTDGLWNMISPAQAVSIVQAAEQHNAMSVLQHDSLRTKAWINPSMNLVERALERWSNTKMRADNTSVVTLMLDPPGPPRVQVLRNTQRSQQQQQDQAIATNHNYGRAPVGQTPTETTEVPKYPENGLEIMTRYDRPEPQPEATDQTSSVTPLNRYTEEYLDRLHQQLYGNVLETSVDTVADTTDVAEVVVDYTSSEEPCSSSAYDEKDSKKPEKKPESVSESVQINVVSSSSDEKISAPAKRGRSAKSSRTSLPETTVQTQTRRSSRHLRLSEPVIKPSTVKRGRPPKRERNESEGDVSSEEPAPSKLRRSRSLGPRDLLTTSKSTESNSEASKARRGSSTSVLTPTSPMKRPRGRPPKREREGDEENIMSSKKTPMSSKKMTIRSRSLDPKNETITSEKVGRRGRSLGEQSSNVGSSTGRRSRGSSASAVGRNSSVVRRTPSTTARSLSASVRNQTTSNQTRTVGKKSTK